MLSVQSAPVRSLLQSLYWAAHAPVLSIVKSHLFPTPADKSEQMSILEDVTSTVIAVLNAEHSL